MEPVQPVLMNIYQSNTYRKDLSWPHFDDEPRVQEKQQVKDQQSCISVFVARFHFMDLLETESKFRRENQKVALADFVKLMMTH